MRKTDQLLEKSLKFAIPPVHKEKAVTNMIADLTLALSRDDNESALVQRYDRPNEGSRGGIVHRKEEGGCGRDEYSYTEVAENDLMFSK